VTQFFAPAEQAAIPLLVRRENLMAANALFTTTMMGALVLLAVVGPPLLSLATTWGRITVERLWSADYTCWLRVSCN